MYIILRPKNLTIKINRIYFKFLLIKSKIYLVNVPNRDLGGKKAFGTCSAKFVCV